MVAARTSPKLRLVSSTQQHPVYSHPSRFPLPGEAEFPGPPAMPAALLQMELCLSASVVDLEQITNIVRSDAGLTIQLLRLAAREAEASPDMIPIGEMVVQVGVEKLGALVAHTEPLPGHLRCPAGASPCEQFWARCRVTALIAEELAGQSSEVAPESAYLAGLLCHIGRLPSILGWATACPDTGDSSYIGYRMAKSWGFPAVLTDVIDGYREVKRTRESQALLDIVEAADTWAARMEYLAARDAMRLESLFTR